MLKNNIKMAWRSLRKEKLFSLIKIGGFAVGVAACLLISLFILDELSYDKHIPEREQVYRVVADILYNGERAKHVYFPPPMAEALAADYPEIEDAGRILTGSVWAGGTEMRRPEKRESSFEDKMIYADPEMLEILKPQMISGKIDNALSAPNTLIISQRKADQFFPEGDAMGKQMIIDNEVDNPYTVAGVFADLPSNSHLHFDFMLTLSGMELWEGEQGQWNSSNYWIYIKTAKGVDHKDVELKLESFKEAYLLPELIKSMSEEDARVAMSHNKFILQPISDIHLKSEGITDNMKHGDIRFVWLFGAIAAFILILACINFINLSTAKSANRAKEVGLRKTVGAFRSELLTQFLTESMVYSFFSFIIGLFLTWLLLPYFNDIAAKDINIPWSKWWFAPLMILSTFLIGILAGLYPAFYLSSFRPSQVLKGSVATGAKSGRLRSILVIFQFTTSIILIIGTLVVYQQMDFILNKELGYDKDQVLLVQGSMVLEDRVDAFKEELKRIPDVEHVTMSSYLPVDGMNRNGNSFWVAGRQKEDQGVAAQIWRVDHDYISTLGMTVLEGRDFSREMRTDSADAIIINQSMVDKMGLDPALGAEIVNHAEIWTVIGVMEDFHFNELKESMSPVALVLGESRNAFSIKYAGNDHSGLRKKVQTVWDKFVPHQSFRHTYLDQEFRVMHEDVQRIGTIFNSFTLFALLVACLGLFALSAFMVEQRKKEISIRLVLGASFRSIYKLLSLDFLKLVLISIIIAAPIGWFMMQRWLEDYSYRIEIGWEVFLLSGLIALCIAILTISYQSIGAALIKPLDGLRVE